MLYLVVDPSIYIDLQCVITTSKAKRSVPCVWYVACGIARDINIYYEHYSRIFCIKLNISSIHIS